VLSGVLRLTFRRRRASRRGGTRRALIHLGAARVLLYVVFLGVLRNGADGSSSGAELTLSDVLARIGTVGVQA
jgi:hypothetical protein